MTIESFKGLTVPEKVFTKTLPYFNDLKRKEMANFLEFTDILPANFENMIIRKRKSKIYEQFTHWYSKIHSN